MPNRLNYGDPIDTTLFQRPERVSKVDRDLLNSGQQSIVFGTDRNDVVEIWIYNPDGTFAGHINLPYNDPALTLVTVLDQSRTAEMLNIDFKDVLNRINLQPGRYALVANFFRDEIGSEAGYKTYISNISSDRLSVTIEPTMNTPQALHDIYEFIVPSVPKQFAKGLIDQAFGVEQAGSADSEITPNKIAYYLNATAGDTVDRIHAANADDSYHYMVTRILNSAYSMALDLMAEDSQNTEIQYVELEGYLEKALDQVIYSMKQRGEIDPRFELR